MIWLRKSTFILVFVITALAQSGSKPLSDATALIRAGKLPAAEAATREFLQIHRESADGHYLLGYILFLQAKAKESLAEYTVGARYRTPDAHDLKVVASDYVVLGDFPDADKWFTKVVEWAPQDEQAWYDLGRTKYNENRFDDGLAALQRALQLDPADVKAEDNLGLCYSGLGKTDEAAAAFHRAIDMQRGQLQKSAEPYLNLASLLIERTRDKEALPFLEQAAALPPRDYRVHREFGKAYLHLEELDKSSAEFRRAISEAPGDATLHFMLSTVYRKLGQTTKAEAEIKQYQALKQQSP